MTAPTKTPGASTLFLKLANIIGDIKSIPKSGHNDFHGYDYVTANDLINAVRDRLAGAGIMIFTSVKTQEVREIKSGEAGKEKCSFLTLVTLEHTFCDAETGETFTVLSQGQGSDVGDKGGYKAITGAMKYFIYKCFMIPTDEDGSEIETTVTKRAGGFAGATGKALTTPPPGEINWREVAIHFGVHKGKKLGDLSEQALRAWFNWKPNPRFAKAEDPFLLRALEDAAAELSR